MQSTDNHPLHKKKCRPCEGSVGPMDKAAATKHLQQTPSWELNGEATTISKKFITKNFMAALDLIKKIADIAESEDHHPDIHLTDYRKLMIVLSTHAISGLSENDFIVAAKIDQLPVELKT